MANRLLADMESGEIRKQGGNFPVRHGVLAAVLVLMVALIYVYVQTEPQIAESDDVAGTVRDAAPELAAGATDVAVAEDVPASAGRNSAAELDVDEPAEEAVEAAEAAAAGADAAEETEEAIEEAIEEVEEAVAARERTREPVEEAVAEAARVADAPAAEPTLQTEPEPAVAVVESVPADPLPEEAAPAQPDVATSPTVEDRATPSAGYRDAAWILAQDESHFTMQLLSLSSLERAQTFINRQSDPGEFALYRTQRDGRSLFVVTYGLFSSRAAATAAAQNLSGELAGIEPWIRPLRLVQDTVRNNEQN